MRGQGRLTLWFDGKYIDTSSNKISYLSYFRFRRKKNFRHFFNITSMGEKLIPENHLTPALISSFLGFRLKIGKNKEMILGKFESGARPGTWWSRQLKFRCKSIINSCKNKVKTSNFKIFFIYTLCSWIICVKYKNWGYTKNFVGQWFRSCDTNFLFFDKKILKLWPQCVKISNNVVYKWTKFWNSKS